jgi:TatD DNase family protein
MQIAKKPIVIHTREAWDDTIKLIREHWDPERGGIMHCFSGNPEQAQQALDLGFYLSFGGIVTFPKALEIQESARMAPIDRILVETDAPYLAPVPKRGKRNEPAFMVETVRKLAQLRGESEQAIADSTTNNFRRLMSL